MTEMTIPGIEWDRDEDGAIVLNEDGQPEYNHDWFTIGDIACEDTFPAAILLSTIARNADDGWLDDLAADIRGYSGEGHTDRSAVIHFVQALLARL